MSHTFLTSLRWPGLSDMLVESERRVRRGLKTLAFYAKVGDNDTFLVAVEFRTDVLSCFVYRSISEEQMRICYSIMRSRWN